jgi:hypothetical protein
MEFMHRSRFRTMLLLVGWAISGPSRAEELPVRPYVQNPTPDGMTLLWFAERPTAGTVRLKMPGGERRSVAKSTTQLAEALQDNPWKPEFPQPRERALFRHRVRLSGLEPGTRYEYTVTQPGYDPFQGEFQTAPEADQPIRFVVYSDSETEPESSTLPGVEWPASPGSNRPKTQVRYPANQTDGYRENLKVMAAAQPQFICVVGDLVENGGEQRDWDEFWQHNAGDYGQLASRVPLFPALGNHENYAGPGGGHAIPAVNFAVSKYLTYFETPNNGARQREHVGRYYRVDYGPVTLICLDSSDGSPHQSPHDTNFNLQASHAPDFNPGSEQFEWLEAQLADAQRRSQFTFVQFHHSMVGSGMHSLPLDHPNFQGHPGSPLRVLLPTLLKYGVDAVFSGHDEMWERSEATGEETRPEGETAEHTLQLYDVGVGGDGLRGPMPGAENPFRKFLAHVNAPEVWQGRRLVSGGKHYGHLEVNVSPTADGWEAVLTPVYVFPLMNDEGSVTGWERRTHDDVIRLRSRQGAPTAAGAR